MGNGNEANAESQTVGRSDRSVDESSTVDVYAGTISTTESVTVLAVDDLSEYLKLYRARLDGTYDVITAADGESALEALDDSVDVVLLDRSMPGLSGDDVLERIHSGDHDCRVAMVTAVEPDFDIIDLGFDAYLTKPVSKDTLHETVDRLIILSSYSESLSELYTLNSKRAVLKHAKDEDELRASEKYRSLQNRMAELHAGVDDTAAEFGHDDYRATFRDLSLE